MEFYKEVLQKRIDYNMAAIERAKKEIKKITPESYLLWEVAEMVEKINEDYKSLSYDHCGCGLYCSIKPITPEEYDSLLSDIDSIMNESLYYMDLDYKQPTYISGQRLKYLKDGADTELYITLTSTECKLVNTGKMVPETKSECNLIVNG